MTRTRVNGWMRWSALAVAALSNTLASSAFADAALTIQFAGASGPYLPGQQVLVKLRMSGIPAGTPAAGFQAFLRFDSTRLAFVGGAYTSVPFAQHILAPIGAVGEDISLAAGLSAPLGQQPSATDADLATLTFQVLSVCGVGAVQFRTNNPPTRITDMNVQSIVPLTLQNLAVGNSCPGDIYQTGTVNTDDLLVVVTNWGRCAPGPACCPGNVNGDTAVNTDDLIVVIASWGACP